MNKSDAVDRTKLIARLNDALRLTFSGGSVHITAGISALDEAFVAEALEAVRRFNTFNADNDPYAEHDFGMVVVRDKKLFWKIDYYDPRVACGSEDPANPNITHRVLTVMFAEEY